MRELIIRLSANPVHRNYFDLVLVADSEETLLEKKTPEQIHNLIRAELNRAMENL